MQHKITCPDGRRSRERTAFTVHAGVAANVQGGRDDDEKGRQRWT